MILTQKIRSLLHDKTNISPLYNPMSVPDNLPDPLVIDLTVDVSNTTRIYHPNTEAIQDLLRQADALVCDTEALAATMRQFNSRVVITPFGFSSRRDIEGDGFTIGLLNHDPDYQLNNQARRKLLKGLKEPLLIYGEAIDGLDDCELCEDFEEFAGRCDVLLLPSLDRETTSVTLPLSVMMSETVVIASAKNSGFYSLDPASGVRLMATDRASDWKNVIAMLERNPLQLQALKTLNHNYVKRIAGESLNVVGRLEQKLRMAVAA